MAEAKRDIGAVGGGGRVWRRHLFSWEEESVRECSILLSNTVLQNNVHDVWRWLLDPIHGYSVRGAYHFLTTIAASSDITMVDDVWHKYIPSKVSVLVWRLLRNRLPTKDNLVQRQVIPTIDMDCITGCGGLETSAHLFLHSTYSALFGTMYGAGYTLLGCPLVTSDNIFFISHQWRSCLDSLTRL